MTSLNLLKNTHREKRPRKRVGRGIGSGHGKTSGRGHKGAGSRAGYKRRWGYEGGQMRLHMRTPMRGFSNFRFQRNLESVNLYQIEQAYQDGETVNLETLKAKGLVKNNCQAIKLLGDGETTRKKLTIEVDAISSSARDKLSKTQLSVTVKA